MIVKFKIIHLQVFNGRCDNELYGCSAVVKLDSLSHHLKECEHNPKKPVPCSQGCGLTVPKDEMVNFLKTSFIKRL